MRQEAWPEQRGGIAADPCRPRRNARGPVPVPGPVQTAIENHRFRLQKRTQALPSRLIEEKVFFVQQTIFNLGNWK
jgi:hypothetical protein